MAFAVGEERDERKDREQPAPEKQRAFLSRPERGEFIPPGKIAIAVLDDVSDGKIVLKEKGNQAGHRQRNQKKSSHARVARALDKQRTARANADDSGDECVSCGEQRED